MLPADFHYHGHGSRVLLQLATKLTPPPSSPPALSIRITAMETDMWNFLLDLAPKVVSGTLTILVIWWLSPNLLRGLGLMDDNRDD